MAVCHFCVILQDVGFLSYDLELSSVILLMAVSVDRYIKTSKPLSFFFSTQRSKRVCFIISVTCVILAFPTLLVYDIERSTSSCMHKKEFETYMVRYQGCLMTLVLVGCLVMSFSYLKVGLVIRIRQLKRCKGRKCLQVSSPATQMGKTSSRLSDVFHRALRRHRIDQALQDNNSEIALSKSSSKAWQEQSSRVANSSETTTRNTSAFTNYVGAPSTLQSYNPPSVDIIKETSVNRTTKLLFLITFVFIITHIIPFIVIFSGFSLLGIISRFFTMSLNLINCIANPFFCICIEFPL